MSLIANRASLERGKTGSQTSFEGAGGQSQRTASRAAHGQEHRAPLLPLPSTPATMTPNYGHSLGHLQNQELSRCFCGCLA